MLLLAAGLAGYAILAVEILGVHYLAPWFGTSSLVWTNQIGIVLLALVVGYWIGGLRSRTTSDPLRLAGWLLATAGLGIAAFLFLLPLYGAWVLPEEMRLDEAAGVFLGGSLGAALLFYAPPVLLLGMVSPLLVQARSAARVPGRAAGEVTAAGTLGSLAGVFGTTYLGIPFLGTHLTLGLSAGLLALAGLLLLRRPAAAVVVLAALIPSVLADPARAANLPAGFEVIAAAETPYQRLRVLESTGETVPAGERWLQMNEGLDSFQSRWVPAGGWPGGYYDLFVLAPLYALEADDPGPVFFLSLGHGAGSALLPVAAGMGGREWRATGIEIDPMVVELSEQYLPLQDWIQERVFVVSGQDARSLLRAAPRDLDFLLLDAYARQFEIPLHLATEEFFAEVESRLRPGGVFALNVGTSEEPGGRHGILDPIRAALARAFDGRVRAHRVPFSRNWLLFARKDADLASLEELALRMPPGVPVELGVACLPSSVLDGAPAGEPARLRDARNPLTIKQALLWLAAGE